LSFFGNNSRPDLLKNSENQDRGARGSDTRFLGETGAPVAPEPPPSPFTAESRSAGSSASPSSGATPPDRCTNVVAAGARWKGSLQVDDSVRIDGVFSGEIQSKGTVHVSDGAEVDAKLNAAFVVVSGNLRGEIRADQKVELLPKSRVSGEILTKSLSIQEGAVLDGSVQMTSDGARTTSGRGARNGVAAESEAERRQAESKA
jgi:cytoskeletal protein CcmA (bactofilin family)